MRRCPVIRNKPLTTIQVFMLLTLRGWGLVARGTNHVIRVLEFSAPPRTFPREEGLGMELVRRGEWFSQSCLCCEACIKSLKKGFRELPNWRAHQRTRRWWCWRGREALCPFPQTLPSASLPFGCILYKKPEIVSPVSPWVLWAVVAHYQTWGWGLGTCALQLVGQKS